MAMDIPGIASASDFTRTTPASGPNKTLGKEDFLRLLTAQMKAQNPLNPMDSTGFTAQLAQFSSLEQLTNISSELTSMAQSQSALQSTLATDLIGKRVQVAGNTITLNGEADLTYMLGSASSKTTISIYDANGNLVRTASVGQAGAGEQTYHWDGRDANGNAMPAGQYTYAVAAVDSADRTVQSQPLTTGTIPGVSFDTNTTYLIVDGNREVKLGDIHEILGGGA